MRVGHTLEKRAVFLLREVFEFDFDEIARSVGKSEANTRQILTRARRRLRDSRPRFTVSRRESEEVVRRFRPACGLLMRHAIAGNGTCSFDIADGRIRVIYVARNPDKLRGFLERSH